MDNSYITVVNSGGKNSSRWVALIVGVAVVIGSIILAVFVFGRNSDLSQVVDIVNYSEIEKELPTDARDLLRNSLYDLLAAHFDVPNEANKVKAVVRIDTLEKSIAEGSTGVSFIMDIDEYRQTYDVMVSWFDDPDLPMNISVGCTRRDVAKFPEAMCYGMYDTSDSLELYLPYEWKTESGKEFLLEFGYYNEDGSEVVIAFVENCDKNGVKKDVISAAKKFIESVVGADPEAIEIEVVYVYKHCLVK